MNDNEYPENQIKMLETAVITYGVEGIFGMLAIVAHRQAKIHRDKRGDNQSAEAWEQIAKAFEETQDMEEE